jgi:putative hydrolase of the HAD superfamily
MVPVMIVRDQPLRDWDGPVVRDLHDVVKILLTLEGSS